MSCLLSATAETGCGVFSTPDSLAVDPAAFALSAVASAAAAAVYSSKLCLPFPFSAAVVAHGAVRELLPLIYWSNFYLNYFQTSNTNILNLITAMHGGHALVHDSMHDACRPINLKDRPGFPRKTAYERA